MALGVPLGVPLPPWRSPRSPCVSSPPSVPHCSEPCFFPGNVKKPTKRTSLGYFLPSDIRAELCKWFLNVNEPRFDMQRVTNCCCHFILPPLFLHEAFKQASVAVSSDSFFEEIGFTTLVYPN